MIFQSAISSTDLSIYSVTYPLIQFRPPFFFFASLSSLHVERNGTENKGRQRKTEECERRGGGEKDRFNGSTL